VKVETEVVARHFYARSRTEINNQSMALLKKYILKRFFSEANPENIANVATEIIARHSNESSCTEIKDLNMDGIEMDAMKLKYKTR
jgi:hypothetical protein